MRVNLELRSQCLTGNEIYRRGSDPAVIIHHEMPGITPALAGEECVGTDNYFNRP